MPFGPGRQPVPRRIVSFSNTMKKSPQRESAHVREYISIVAPSQHVTIADGQIERHLNLTIMSADPQFT